MTTLRLDDLGASSKLYERHRGKWFAYREMTAGELDTLGVWLHDRNFSMTLAITACWVEADNSLTPYPEKFPDQTHVIRYWIGRGVFDVACHGLTHCVVGGHRPRLWPFRGNRTYHREFTVVSLELMRAMIATARTILEGAFSAPVTTLVPPGYLIPWPIECYAVAQGLTVAHKDDPGVVLHDRDIVERGVQPVMEALPPAIYVSCEKGRSLRSPA